MRSENWTRTVFADRRPQDLNQDTIYRKTAKGAQAIAARLHGLVGKSRSMLILVDGKRNTAELLALGKGFGDVAPLLAQLAADGFIEAIAPATTTAPAPPATPVAAPRRSLTLEEAKSYAAHRLMEVLGPTSEPLCLRIEAARNVDEFVDAVKRAYAVVRDIRGASEAERFGSAVEANLPAP